MALHTGTHDGDLGAGGVHTDIVEVCTFLQHTHGQLGFAFGAWEISDTALSLRQAVTPSPAEVENTAALGQLLYTKYVLLFQLAGLVLLVAMVGAIVLTLHKRADVKRQDVLAQMYRDPKAAVRLVDIKPGQGA